MASFNVVYDGVHGPTVHSSNPKLDAYKYIAHVLRADKSNATLIRGYQLISHIDGSITVDATGLMPITFESGN